MMKRVPASLSKGEYKRVVVDLTTSPSVSAEKVVVDLTRPSPSLVHAVAHKESQAIVVDLVSFKKQIRDKEYSEEFKKITMYIHDLRYYSMLHKIEGTVCSTATEVITKIVTAIKTMQKGSDEACRAFEMMSSMFPTLTAVSVNAAMDITRGDSSAAPKLPMVDILAVCTERINDSRYDDEYIRVVMGMIWIGKFSIFTEQPHVYDVILGWVFPKIRYILDAPLHSVHIKLRDVLILETLKFLDFAWRRSLTELEIAEKYKEFAHYVMTKHTSDAVVMPTNLRMLDPSYRSTIDPSTRYESKLTMLGEGSYGAVCAIELKGTHTVRAIKRQTPNPVTLRLALRERNIMAVIEPNPYIVRAFRSFIHKNNFFIEMEFAECGDLNRVLKAPQTNIESCIRTILRAVIPAVEFLHSHDLVHCDIKLGNIVMYADKTIKLADFGLCENTRRMPDSIFNEYDVKQAYLDYVCAYAPETIVILKDRNTNSRLKPEHIDVWAVANLVYQIQKGAGLDAKPMHTFTSYAKHVDVLKGRVSDPFFDPPCTYPVGSLAEAVHDMSTLYDRDMTKMKEWISKDPVPFDFAAVSPITLTLNSDAHLFFKESNTSFFTPTDHQRGLLEFDESDVRRAMLDSRNF